MEKVSEAIIFAVKAHDGMRRKKSDAPYILHPMEAAVIVGSMTDDQDIITAAVLHDVVEDTNATLDDIETNFGSRIRKLVESETEDKRPDIPAADSWRIRKEESLEVLKNTDDIAVLMVWLGDKLANMRSIYRDFQKNGNAMWEGFNQKDPQQHAWYYTEIANLTRKLSVYSAWHEYKQLVEAVFKKGN